MHRVRKIRKYQRLGQRTGTGLRCWYCGEQVGRKNATRDHQTPRVNGGTNRLINIVLACRPCNLQKDDMELEAYRAFLLADLPAGERVVFYGEKMSERGHITNMKVLFSEDAAASTANARDAGITTVDKKTVVSSLT